MAVAWNGASDQRSMRRSNLRATFAALRTVDSATLSELARVTTLSRQTVEVVIAELVAAGWAEELPPEQQQSKGRPARRVRFRAEHGVVIGLDIGAHKVVALVANLAGTVLASVRQDIPEDLPGPDRLAKAYAAATDALAQTRYSPAEVLAAAVGTIGIVDTEGRVLSAEVLPDWTGLDLAGQVGRWFGCPGFAENDANCAALAEHWTGAARPYDDVVHLLVGFRTSASLMIGGVLHRGRNGVAGEVGALEELGWIGAAREMAADGDAEAVFRDARAGKPAALAAVEAFAGRLATGIAALVLAVDPEVVVLGGGYSRAADVLLGPIRRQVAAKCIVAPNIVASTSGDESVALGAIRRALDHVDERILP